MRLIIYTGKGKSSMAVLSAVNLAKRGYKTLIINEFSNELTNCPVSIETSLWALDIGEVNNNDWNKINDWLRKTTKWQSLNGISTSEIPIIPGINQLLSLLEVKKYLSDFDVVIYSCDLAGEVARLLCYPELLKYWSDKIDKSNSYIYKMVRPLTKVFSGGLELPDSSVITSGEKLIKEVIELQKIILNPEVTTFRLVLYPEKKVLHKLRKKLMYLLMMGFTVDCVMINKVLPDELKQSFLSDWLTEQENILDDIYASFSPLPILKIPLFEIKLNNLESYQLKSHLFHDTDLAKVLFSDRIYSVNKDINGYILIHKFRQISDEPINLNRNGNELTIEIGNEKRLVYLPKLLQNKTIGEAYFQNDELFIEFTDKLP